MGVLYAVAKGAKKPGSRLAGISEPLSASIVHLASGRNSSYITQAQPATSFPGLRADYDRLRFALSLAEIASAVLPQGKPCAESFSFLLGALRLLETHDRPDVVHVWAQVKLLGLAGLSPHFNRCVVSGGAIREASPFLSVRAGGYVCDSAAPQYGDRFRVRAEALFGLAKLTEQESPPQNLKFAEEARSALYKFWLDAADCPLPATKACLPVP